jgi:hypothetical protein
VTETRVLLAAGQALTGQIKPAPLQNRTNVTCCPQQATAKIIVRRRVPLLASREYQAHLVAPSTGCAHPYLSGVEVALAAHHDTLSGYSR